MFALPTPNNTHDCGIFVMEYAEHVVMQKTIQFAQSVIMYYRVKLVTDLYIYQFSKYGDRVASDVADLH